MLAYHLGRIITEAKQGEPVKYEGYNGQIELGDHELVITRDGMKARALFGKGTPERRIPLQALSGVRLKEATRLLNGWVQLLLGGEPAAELSKGNAPSNANAVMFTHGKKLLFQQLHAKLEAIVAENAAAGIDPSQVDWDGLTGQQGRFDKKAAQAGATAEEKTAQRVAKAEAAGLRPDIAQASARMGWKFGGKREIRKLQEHLHEDELVQYIAQGSYDGNQGIVVLTGERLLFVFHGHMRQAVEDFPLSRLTSVQTKAGLVMGDLTVYASGNSAVIKSIVNDDMKQLASAVRDHIRTGEPSSQAAPPAAPFDLADELAKLAALRDQGILTEDEFSAQKTKLLSQ